MQISSKTDKGKVRLSNQDSFYTVSLSDSCVFAIVCDGMGGANAGNVASETATKIISDYVKRSIDKNMDSRSLALMLQSSIVTANAEIYEMAQKSSALSGMGTTVVSAVVKDNVAVICSAGDSRAYLINDEISQITRDHSVVQSLVETGKLTEKEAKVHPNKNVITKALGVEENILCDYYEVKVKEGDNILLCSDGLTNFVDNSQILEQFKNENGSDIAENLVNIANGNGGGDNITAVVISI